MTARDSGTPDLAYATVRGVPDMLVMRDEKYGWVTSHRVDGARWHPADVVADIVPVRAVPETHVVLDPEDAGQMLHVAELFARTVCHLPEATRLAQTFRTLAAEQSRPPLAEPGLWGVVKAARRSQSGGRGEAVLTWVRYPGGWLLGGSSSDAVTWADLLDPVLVRPGVDDEAKS